MLSIEPLRPYTVYLITNVVNNKGYVGYTVKTPEQRWSEHVYLAKTPVKRRLSQAIRKYGPENFRIKWISTAPTLELAKLFEERLILVLNTFGQGYNMTKGGDGSGPHTEEYKRYMSGLMKKRVFSKETRKKMSDSAKGKPKSEEFKRQVSAKQKADPNISERNRRSALLGHARKAALKLQQI